MVNSLINAASFDRKFVPQDAPRRSKRVCFPVKRFKEEEEEYEHNDEHYLQKIHELVDQKMKLLFARENGVFGAAELETKPHIATCSFTMPMSDEKDDNIMKKKKKIIIPTNGHEQKIPKPVVSNHITDRLKEFITQKIKGVDMKLVIQKILYITDLTKSQNRLSMPINQLETHEFLTADEIRDLENGKEFGVPLLGPTLCEHEKPMVLKMWHLANTNNYVLKNNWYKFVEKNKEHLKEKTKIQVWSYHKYNIVVFLKICKYLNIK